MINEVFTPHSSWITPDGEVVEISAPHELDAVRRFKEMGKHYSDKHKAYRDLMELKGYIRMVRMVEEGLRDMNVSVMSKVNSTQLSVIAKLARDVEDFYYDVFNPKTEEKDQGFGYREFVEALKTCDLLESVVAR